MGRCKRLSIFVCVILALISSAKTIALGESEVETYILNPVDASKPTYNDNGDRISGILSQQAHFAFDLSSIPENATIVSAAFSAYFSNQVAVSSVRQIWYNSDDSWIFNPDESLSDPGDSVVADEIIGTFWHTETPDDGYVWKTISITYDGWENDIADGYISLMLTGGQYFGAVGQGPTTLGYNWGVDKEPELTLKVLSDDALITVLSPNGGESWQAGTMNTITWYSNGTAGENVKIELYKNDSYLSDIIASTANDGEHMWLVPSNLSAGNTYKVKIIDTGDSSTYDFSDNYFNIADLFPSSGSLQFKSSTYSGTEDGGIIRIYVSRTGGSYGAASVSYVTSDGTALAGSDYTANSGALSWANEDTADKYFDVSIINDDTYEGNETFAVSLKNVIGADLGSPSQATVIITDDESSPYVIYPPEVETLYSINITTNTATLVGLLENDGSEETEENCTCRFSYWKASEPGIAELTDWQSGISQGKKFSTTISGLDPNTVYLFYAQASNSAGTADGSSLSFNTYPDPNLPPVAFDVNEPNTLLIQNFVEVLYNDPNKPHNNQGLITYVEGIGLDGIDPNDIFYSVPVAAQESKIVSLISWEKGQTTGFYELSKDVRPDNAQDSLLELSIYSSEPNDPNVYSENYLKFWLAKNAFKGKTVTIQKISSDPNIIYPVWDVNEIINKNDRKMPLSDLVEQKLNTPYAWFTLSTDRQILDINEDGIVDLLDYALLIMDVGKTGIYRSDIACMKNTVIVAGIPDGDVNDVDVIAFITEYNTKNPGNPIPNPYAVFIEDFENEQLQESFTSYGDALWRKSSDSHEGFFSATSGDIDDNQVSVLEANINASMGNISFWRKVWSESNFDCLLFYIDDEEKGRWSGLLDWEQVSFQVTSGDHNLKWVYIKDNSISHGQDAAWIDDIIIK